MFFKGIPVRPLRLNPTKAINGYDSNLELLAKTAKLEKVPKNVYLKDATEWRE